MQHGLGVSRIQMCPNRDIVWIFTWCAQLALTLIFFWSLSTQFLSWLFIALSATSHNRMKPEILWSIWYLNIRKIKQEDWKMQKNVVQETIMPHDWKVIFEGCSFSTTWKQWPGACSSLLRRKKDTDHFHQERWRASTLVIDYKHQGLLQGISLSLQLKEHQ